MVGRTGCIILSGFFFLTFRTNFHIGCISLHFSLFSVCSHQQCVKGRPVSALPTLTSGKGRGSQERAVRNEENEITLYTWIKTSQSTANKTPKPKHLTHNTCRCASYSFKDRCWGLGCKSSFKQRVLVQTIGLIPGSAQAAPYSLCVHPQRKTACGTSVRSFSAQWHNPCFDLCLAQSKCSEIIFCYH